jgi:dihydrofolate synthase/folylpolyglutamate synthase
MADGPRKVISAVVIEERAELIEVSGRYPGKLNLLGEHQAANAAIAAEVAKRLRIVDKAIADGLQRVTWPARIEVTSREPVVILDCAHNVPSVEALVKTLRQEFPEVKTKTCIFAVSSDKQYREMLPILASYFGRFIFTQYGNNPRCVSPEKLAELVSASISSTVIVPAARAFESAKGQAGQFDLLCVTGSVFLAGELRAAGRA